MLEDTIKELLRPLVEQLVRDEVKRAKLEQRWLPLKRAAQELGLSENALRQRLRAGSVPGKQIDRRWYVDMHSLQQRLDRLR